LELGVDVKVKIELLHYDKKTYGEVEIQLNICYTRYQMEISSQLKTPDDLNPIFIWQDVGLVPELICAQW
jgi:hypothetical protein